MALWAGEGGRSTSYPALVGPGTIHLMPLRFGARFRGTDSWGNPAQGELFGGCGAMAGS